MKPSFVYLYNDKPDPSLKISLLVQYLKEKTHLDVTQREIEIKIDFAERFALAKIIDPSKEELNTDPLKAEIEYEKKILLGQASSGLLYDGFCLQEIYRDLLPKEEHSLSFCHIVFTSRLFGTFSGSRYHARVAVFGHPTIISTSGIVEAPAKPRSFYLKRQLTQDIASLKDEFSDKFIDYGDPRLTEVMKGYLMQAIFYHLIGDPFCADKGCRLYNAHWQEEVIYAQIDGDYEFCPHHQQILDGLSGLS